LIQVVVWVISLPCYCTCIVIDRRFHQYDPYPAQFPGRRDRLFHIGLPIVCGTFALRGGNQSTAKEAQGLAAVFTMFSVAPFWFLSLLMLFPNSRSGSPSVFSRSRRRCW